jgi:hypothetical protein
MRRPPVKWMTDTIITEVELRNELKLRSKNDLIQFNPYKGERTKVRHIISKDNANSHHAELKEAKTDPKETWNIFQRIVSNQTKRKTLKFNNLITTAGTFNKYFASVGETVYKEVIQCSANIPHQYSCYLPVSQKTT